MRSKRVAKRTEDWKIAASVMRFITQASLLALLGLLLLSGRSEAGTMKLYSCHTPTGRSVATQGWTPSSSNVHDVYSDRCSVGPGGTLYAAIKELGSNIAASGWLFNAAPGTSISHFTMSVCGRGAYSLAYTVFLEGINSKFRIIAISAPTAPTIGCAGSSPWCCSAANTISGGAADVQQVMAGAICAPYCSPIPTVEVSNFQADINDTSEPVASVLGGSLATSNVQTGIESLTFKARDVGVGIFRAVAEARIDGTGDWREIVNAPVRASGPCTPVRETNYLYEFASPAPCPASVETSELVLESGVLPYGTHDLRVRVEDAAGNSTTVLPERIYTVPRPPDTAVPASASPEPSNVPRDQPVVIATPPSPPAVLPLAQLTLTGPAVRRLPSAGAFRLGGRLLDSEGNAIPQAIVTIQTRPYFPKSGATAEGWAPLGSAMTDADGQFFAQIPAGASRAILVAYRPGAGDQSPAAVAETNAVAPASVTVRAKRTRVRNGQSVILRGRVAGPIPRGGVRVALEVREPSRWIPVATTRRLVRTSSSGAFQLAYRFRKTFRPATYRFRVVANEDSDFAYSRGASRPIDVRVRP
jgi:hypothetical protein